MMPDTVSIMRLPKTRGEFEKLIEGGVPVLKENVRRILVKNSGRLSYADLRKPFDAAVPPKYKTMIRSGIRLGFSGTILFDKCLEKLKEERIIVEDDGTYSLTEKGKVIIV